MSSEQTSTDSPADASASYPLCPWCKYILEPASGGRCPECGRSVHEEAIQQLIREQQELIRLMRVRLPWRAGLVAGIFLIALTLFTRTFSADDMFWNIGLLVGYSFFCVLCGFAVGAAIRQYPESVPVLTCILWCMQMLILVPSAWVLGWALLAHGDARDTMGEYLLFYAIISVLVLAYTEWRLATVGKRFVPITGRDWKWHAGMICGSVLVLVCGISAAFLGLIAIGPD